MENPFELIIERLDKIERLLQNLEKTEKTASISIPANEILDTQEAAEYLGFSKSTLYKHTSERLVPHYKNGKKLYFKRTELNEWLTKHRITTQEEIEKMATEYIVRNPLKGKRY